MREGIRVDANSNARKLDRRLVAFRSKVVRPTSAPVCWRNTRVSARRDKGGALGVEQENVARLDVAGVVQAPLLVPPSRIAINKSITSAESADAVLDIVSSEAEHLNDVNLATAFHRVGKLGSSDRYCSETPLNNPGLRILVRLILQRMKSFGPKALGSMAWAHAEFQHGGPRFMEKLLEQFVWTFERNSDSFGDRELGGVLCACGKLGVGQTTLQRISPILLRKIHTMRGRCTVHVIWACAQLGYSNDSLLQECENVIRRRVGELTLQGQGNMVWALAKLGRFDDELFKELAACSNLRMARANVIDVANFAWGFGKYFDHLAEDHIAGKGILEGDLYSDMEKLYFGLLAEKGYNGFVQVFCARAMEILRQQRYSNITFLSAMMWFMGAVRVKDTELLEVLCSRALQHAQHLGPRSLATVLWCLAKQRHRDVKLLDCLANRGLALLEEGGDEEMNGQTVSMCLYSYAFLNHVDSEPSQMFIECLQEEALKLLDTCSTQGVANIAWAVVTIGKLPEGLLKAITMEVTRRTMNSTMGVFSDVEMTMLHQVQLLLRLEAPHIVMDATNSQPVNEFFRTLYEMGRTRTEAEKKWEKEVVSPTPKVSKFHKEVLKSLEQLEVQCAVEYIDGYPIDIAIVDAKIAIEVDGPSHFTNNSLKPLGGTLLKRRVLKGRGWNILPVPFFEWERYHSLEERMSYMQHKLFQLGVTLPIHSKSDLLKEKWNAGGNEDTNEDSGEAKPPKTRVRKHTASELDERGSRIDLIKYKRGVATKHDLLLRRAKRNLRSKRGTSENV